MEELIEKICFRLNQNAYPNEAAISHGVVLPLLRELGWDVTDPTEIIPEYSTGGGRVDFAICATPKKPSIFIEVKGVGRSLDGDRQLFEYAFHEGVPFCVLTDGKDWNFYFPGGQGSYDERRIYRLQIQDRSPLECADILSKYLDKQRVRSGKAQDDAIRDYRDSANRRDAKRALPQAWSELVNEPEELLVDLLSERAEKLCGVRPEQKEVILFLRSMKSIETADNLELYSNSRKATNSTIFKPRQLKPSSPLRTKSAREVSCTVLGNSFVAANGKEALVIILHQLSSKYGSKVPALAKAVRGSSRNHIAQTVEEIYPARPDLAKAEEFFPGWLVGLNIANREKLTIVRAACEVFGLTYGKDVIADFPNSEN